MKLDPFTPRPAVNLLQATEAVRQTLGEGFRDRVVESIYRDATEIAGRSVKQGERSRFDLDMVIDKVVLSPVLGLPLMIALLGLIFWVTIVGANVPSQMLATGLFWVEAQGAGLFDWLGAPWWLTGVVWHGTYRALAWVIAVMLPPMAIFFPCFTILEDLGYLPRVAFNLDWLFKKSGGHGKQALTMSMGFGCNAAGVIACRVIDSPRERLIAILTNNFVPCNGRYPTLIMIAVVFVAAGYNATIASAVAAATVLTVVVIGVITTLIASAVLSRTILKGEASAFTLEMPSYRRPNIPRIIYTSLIDRTFFVLLRAIATAAPAGLVIWLLGNITAGGDPRVRLPRPVCLRVRARRRHPPGLHHRHPRQRDRRPHHAHGLPRHRHDDRRHQHGLTPRGPGRSTRLDDAYRHQSHALLPAAQPLCHHDHHDMERDPQRTLDDTGGPGPAGDRVRGVFCRRSGGEAVRLGLNPVGPIECTDPMRLALPWRGHGFGCFSFIGKMPLNKPRPRASIYQSWQSARYGS